MHLLKSVPSDHLAVFRVGIFILLFLVDTSFFWNPQAFAKEMDKPPIDEL